MTSNVDHDDILKKMQLGVRRGVAKALAEHKAAGRSIAVWENEKIVHIPPEKIEVFDPEIDYPDDPSNRDE